MDKNEYYRKLADIRGSRKNDIITAVNQKMEKNKVELRDEVESLFFDDLMEEAQSHEKKYGFWPIFEMCEIDYDDPILDIYRD